MSAKHMRKALRAFLMSCKEDYKMYLLLSYCGNILHRVLSNSDLALVSKHGEPAIPPSDSDTEQEKESTDYLEVRSPDLFYQYAEQGDPDENTRSMPYNQVLL